MIAKRFLRSLPSLQRFSTIPAPPTLTKTTFDGEMARLYLNFFKHASPVWDHTLNVVEHSYSTRRMLPETILDIASGPGEPGCSLANAYPKAKVMVTDGADAMIDLAKNRIEWMNLQDQVEAFKMDMNEITNSKIEKESVDLATAQFALMFTSDLPDCLNQIHSVLRPNGVLIGTVWEEFFILPLLKDTMTAVLGQVPPPPPINPLSLADASKFDQELKSTGFIPEGRHNEKGIIQLELGSLEKEDTIKTILLPVTPQLNELEANGKVDAWKIAKEAMREAVYAHGAVNQEGNLFIKPSTYRYFVASKI